MLKAKYCPNCNRTLPLDAFGSNRSRKDGRADSCRECVAKYLAANRETLAKRGRARYAANPETERARRRAYYAANRETVLARDAAYKLANRETIAVKNAARYAANRETELARAAAWRAANSEKIPAMCAAWRAANPARVAAYQAAYLATNQQTRYTKKNDWHDTHKSLITDLYVANILRDHTGLKRSDIPQSLITLKRAHIQLQRELKNEHQ